MTFRTPAEAVALANDTRYGLAASVWSESVNLALDIAPKLKCGVVWINSTNLFDAACGFGGYRESGFGREGGREGMWEYLRPAWEKALPGKGWRKAQGYGSRVGRARQKAISTRRHCLPTSRRRRPSPRSRSSVRSWWP